MQMLCAGGLVKISMNEQNDVRIYCIQNLRFDMLQSPRIVQIKPRLVCLQQCKGPQRLLTCGKVKGWKMFLRNKWLIKMYMGSTRLGGIVVRAPVLSDVSED